MREVGEDGADAGCSVGPKPRPNGTLKGILGVSRFSREGARCRTKSI